MTSMGDKSPSLRWRLVLLYSVRREYTPRMGSFTMAPKTPS